MPITEESLRSPSDLIRWQTVWDNLARECRSLLFSSPAWVTAWWRTWEPGATLRLLVDGDPAHPTGLLPLAMVRRRLHPRFPLTIPLTVVAGSGRGAADFVGALATTANSRERLWHAALDKSTASLHVTSTDPADAAVLMRIPKLQQLTRRPCPSLSLAQVSSTDELWDAKLRKNLRRRERLLQRAGLTRRWVALRPESTGLLLELQRLHVERWRSRGGAGLFDDRRLAFLTALAEVWTSSIDGPCLELIEGEAGIVAVLLGFRYGTTFASYKTGWDPALRELGLGILLHSAAIQYALKMGCDRYDFLRGTEDHKRTLGGGDQVTADFFAARGVAGTSVLARERLVLTRDRRRNARDYHGRRE